MAIIMTMSMVVFQVHDATCTLEASLHNKVLPDDLPSAQACFSSTVKYGEAFLTVRAHYISKGKLSIHAGF